MAGDGFFDERTGQSEVKTHIVEKYFAAWAKVMVPRVRRKGGRLAYVDLFAGPGRYQDGARSTPLLVLARAIADADLCKMLVAVFNDGNKAYAEALRQEIESLAGIEKLAHKPEVWCLEVGEEMAALLESVRLIPALFFVDPWGYKGVTLRLINAPLANWGCDCVFFFNYTRINAALANQAVRPHMEALFGPARLRQLVADVNGLGSEERETAVVEAITEALREGHGEYVLPFRFVNARGTRTSHHLVFVTKHPLGYGIMKDIMARESSSREQGVPSFEYNPATARQPLLFELTRLLDDLPLMLLERFAGQTLTMEQVFDRHNVGTRFVKANYKAALRGLEEGGLILADPPKGKRRSRHGEVTFADSVRVTFPPKRMKANG